MKRRPILHQLGPEPGSPFPPPARALTEPDGLLAFGGDLSPARLVQAYGQGIFPWYSEGQPVLWWCPDPRMVFDSAGFALPSRFRRQLRNSTWSVRADTRFSEVVHGCATTPRPGQSGTWLTRDMVGAYCRLHELGHAHSIEVFDGERLLGGIYGVALGQMFFGESMFSLEPGASKVALAMLLRLLESWGWPLLDAQVENPHLVSLGGRRMPRTLFLERISALVEAPGKPGPWTALLPDWPASCLSKPLE